MQSSQIQNYMEYLFRIALKKCGNLNDAEDLTQEVLLAALQYPKEIMDMKLWLSSALNNKYFDMLRKKYKLPTVSIDLVPEEFEPWETNETETKTEDEYNALPSYQKYKENKTADNLRELCCEIEKICREIYLEAKTDEERNIYLNMANKL